MTTIASAARAPRPVQARDSDQNVIDWRHGLRADSGERALCHGPEHDLSQTPRRDLGALVSGNLTKWMAGMPRDEQIAGLSRASLTRGTQFLLDRDYADARS